MVRAALTFLREADLLHKAKKEKEGNVRSYQRKNVRARTPPRGERSKVKATYFLHSLSREFRRRLRKQYARVTRLT